MKVLCIDIGNTHTHFGTLENEDGSVEPHRIPTSDLDRNGSPLARELASRLAEEPRAGLAFCSVVPEADERLRRFLASFPGAPEPFQLTRTTLPPSVRLHYPCPDEIGQDRLANAVAASRFHRPPCVVIDLGTAVTFDIVSGRNGYEGGIIAPGIGVMTGYLHRQTALLPQLDEPLEWEGAIGKSTRQAMTIGCAIGFRGMIEALLTSVRRELADAGEPDPQVILTGGTAAFLFRKNGAERSGSGNKLAGLPVLTVPDLTLKGLAHAYRTSISQ